MRRLDKAFAAFFLRVKAGEKPGYSRFKGVGHFDTVAFPKDGDGCRWDSTTSDGEHVADPRFLDAVAGELAEAQRHLARFPKRTRQPTKRHRAAARQVATLQARIRRQSADFHHKTARTLVRDHDVIAHERLNTAGMTKSPAPKPDPEQPGGFLPNGAAAKAGLNRSVLYAGWAQFLAILANKAESAGRLVVPVDARNTSRACPECGHAAKENRGTQAKFACTACGFTANADHVGATNVLDRAGLVLCDVAQPSTQEARASTRGWSHGHRVGVDACVWG